MERIVPSLALGIKKIIADTNPKPEIEDSIKATLETPRKKTESSNGNGYL